MGGSNNLAKFQLVGNGTGNIFRVYGGFGATIGSGEGNAILLDSNVAPTSGSNTKSYNQLKIAPTYNQQTFGTGTLRGIYYNPALTSLNGSTHEAMRLNSGDVIIGALATGGADQMVTVDTNGKLKKAVIVGGTQDLDSVLTQGNTSLQAMSVGGFDSTVLAGRAFITYDTIGPGGIGVGIGDVDENANSTCIYLFDHNRSILISADTIAFQGNLGGGGYIFSDLSSAQRNQSFYDRDGKIAIVDGTANIDLSAGDFTLEGSYVYNITDATTNSIFFPDPSLYEGESITIINSTIIDATVDTTIKAFISGSAANYTVIGGEKMYIFKSVLGKWCGGVLG